jgi:ribosomal protein L11 methyltransferase
VIDVGTGSGVLALAAVRLGARTPVTAIDEDPDALQNAHENAARNGLTRAVTLVECGLGRFASAPADLVLANLTGAVISAHAGALRALVAPGGRLVVSGFGPDELDEVSASLGAAPVAAAHEGEWVGAVYAFVRS